MLAGNWRQGSLADGTPYGFTCPAPPRYRHQWYWDSCFHAIVWRHFEPARAREELRTLHARWSARRLHPPHDLLARRRRVAAGAVLRHPLGARRSRDRAHPDAVARARLGARRRRARPTSPGFATEALDALRLHYDWLDRHRDPDGDGLISIIHPDESGLDDSPKYDAVFGWMSHYLPGYFWLVERSRRLRYDSRAIIARYDEHVEDVLVNVFYALSLRALARLTGDDAYRQRAERTERALVELCWDEERGLFWDLAGRGPHPAARLDLVLARAAGAAVAARADRAAADRGAPAPPAPLRRAVRNPVGVDGGAELPGRMAPVPLLARAVVDQHRVAAGAGAPPVRLRGRGRPNRRRPASSSSSATGSASTTTRSTARGWPRGGSAGRRCWSTCSAPRPAGRHPASDDPFVGQRPRRAPRDGSRGRERDATPAGPCVQG